jgi:nicotinamidase/pyrazinamidase
MTRALIVVDVQNDFCEGGALAVAGGNSIVLPINAILGDYPVVVLTQDWHPAGHGSFASTHGAAPFSMTEMPYGPQVLWPDHCIQGSSGAEFHPALKLDAASLIIRKGMDPGIDSYSGFRENDKVTPTGLGGYLRELGVTEVDLVGLATDYCVAYSAIDAVAGGFGARVLLPLCRAIDAGGSFDRSLQAMRTAGVVFSNDMQL